MSFQELQNSHPECLWTNPQNQITFYHHPMVADKPESKTILDTHKELFDNFSRWMARTKDEERELIKRVGAIYESPLDGDGDVAGMTKESGETKARTTFRLARKVWLPPKPAEGKSTLLFFTAFINSTGKVYTPTDKRHQSEVLHHLGF